MKCKASQFPPSSAFGEDVFNTGSTAIILGQLNTTPLQQNLVPLAVYVSICVALSNVKKWLTTKAASTAMFLMQGWITGVFLVAKLPQIIENFRNRSVGELNFTTNFLFLVGNLVRLFTTSQLPQPQNRGALVTAGIGVALNAIVTGQIVAFGKGGAERRRM